MQLNQSSDNDVTVRMARTVFLETNGGASLSAVEAIASMIGNIHAATGRDFESIANDEKIFKSATCLGEAKTDQQHVSAKRSEDGSAINENSSAFQMCLRTVRRMMRGLLSDTAHGATRFHHADDMPEWATGIGYVCEVDGMMFYF